MAVDDFEGPTLEGPGYNFFAITPSDSVDLPHVTRGVYVGGSGSFTADSVNGDTSVTFAGVVAGSLLPIRCSRIRAAGLSASSLVGIY